MNRRDPQNVRALLEQVGRQVVPLPSAEREAALQERCAARVDRLLDELSSERKSTRSRKWLLGVAALAAAIPLAFGALRALAPRGDSAADGPALRQLSGNVELSHATGPASPARAPAALQVGDELYVAPRSNASIELGDRASVELAEQTRVRIVSPSASDSTRDERLQLSEGRVSLRVPKLTGGTLSVQTPNALVTVRGTRFSVGVTRNADSLVTDVSVSEGRVQVDSAGKTLFVLPGERWSSAQDEHPVRAEPGQAASAAGDGSSTSPANRVSPHAVRHVARPSDPASSQASQSTLAEENRVFQGALQRARGGDPEGALDDLDTLAREHPGSPLAQNARVERFRVLHAAGKSAAAAREARRYLSDYPDGFARAEAKRIALSASATKD